MDISPVGIPTKYGRCETCGFVWTAPEYGKGRPDEYLSEADVLRFTSTLIAVRHPAYAHPAVTDERWRTLVGRPELKASRRARWQSLPMRPCKHRRTSSLVNTPRESGEMNECVVLLHSVQ